MKEPSRLPDISHRALGRASDPLAIADKIAAFYRRLEGGHHAGLRLFLQYSYQLGMVLARDKSQFQRLRDADFWRAPGLKPTAGKVMKWTLYYVMRATSAHVRGRAGKYAKILALFHEQNIPPNDVAQLIEDLGGVERILRLLSGRESCEIKSDPDGGEATATPVASVIADSASAKPAGDIGASYRAISLRDKCLSRIAELNSSDGQGRGRARPPRLDDNVVLSEGLFVNMPADKLHAVLRLGDRIRAPIRATLDLAIYPRDAAGWMAIKAGGIVVSPVDLAMASEPDDDEWFDLGESGAEEVDDGFALAPPGR